MSSSTPPRTTSVACGSVARSRVTSATDREDAGMDVSGSILRASDAGRGSMATASAGYGVRGGASGSVNENSVPVPCWLATLIRPPWASTMPLAIARPRPAPPFLVRPCQ